MIIFVSLVFTAWSQNVYDHLRDYTQAFLTGYEEPGYIFPYKTCLPVRTQAAINDKIIGMFFFASNDQWAQVNVLKSQLGTILVNAAKSCDLSDFYNNYQQSYSIATWITRLWWNSILISRTCGQVPSLLVPNTTTAFNYLGSCSKFLFPKPSTS